MLRVCQRAGKNSILKEGVSEEAQDHTGVLAGGSQEFQFGENRDILAGIVQDD